MAPSSDPVADVWRMPGLLGRIASFLDPSDAAWSFIHVSKTAAAAHDDKGQPLPRTVSLVWLAGSGLLATPEGRVAALAVCYRLTRKQREEYLCRCAAADSSLDCLGMAVVAAGLTPPPTSVLVAAAAAGQLSKCRWLVEAMGCAGLVRLPCLCVISAAGPGPGVVEEARAWLAPAALEGWSEAQEATAAGGDVEAVRNLLSGWQPAGWDAPRVFWWLPALWTAQARRDFQEVPTPWPRLAWRPEFYRGPHAALAVTRLTQMDPAELTDDCLCVAAKSGHVEAVRFLLSRRVRPGGYPRPAAAAACGGHVGVLQALREAGCMGEPAHCFREGVKAGSLPVVEWLVATFGAQRLGVDGHTLAYAAQAGSVPLLEALPGLLDAAVPGWDVYRDTIWNDVAQSGCAEAVDWIAKEAARRKMTYAYNAYCTAAAHGDLRMVQRLRKVGCGYSEDDAKALARAASRVPAAASALPWLEEPGRPKTLKAAAAEARVVAVAASTVHLAWHVSISAILAYGMAVGLVVMLEVGGAVDRHQVDDVLACFRDRVIVAQVLMIALFLLWRWGASARRTVLLGVCYMTSVVVLVVVDLGARAAGYGQIVPVGLVENLILGEARSVGRGS
ncbi:hypothetical protein HYH03_005598 [Edaphochlamys debaryana]|uniref:Uncharacterized protein n=1 Tax=Edaphochlamys debaryana TaxID=47281 RepID=A0A835YEY5_9CHLO|nr:hypothetical protein HYH03_005598 [Edaphochlamys debaryana]|eukprot:KAG2496369.1 hypothetical protein HYH03_005598 [Edaphochlamys debaryana]